MPKVTCLLIVSPRSRVNASSLRSTARFAYVMSNSPWEVNFGAVSVASEQPVAHNFLQPEHLCTDRGLRYPGSRRGLAHTPVLHNSEKVRRRLNSRFLASMCFPIGATFA